MKRVRRVNYGIMVVLWVGLLMAAQAAFAQVSYVVNLTTNDLTFAVRDGYNLVSLKGGSFLGEIRKPQMPVKYIRLICPPNTEVDSLVIPVRESRSVSGTYRILPAQTPVPTLIGHAPAQWVDPDTSIYNSNKPYPGKLAEVVHQGYFDGNRIVTIAIYPLQWVPRSGLLSLYTRVRFNLNLRSVNNSPRVRAKIRGERGQEAYRSSLGATVDNDGDIPKYRVEPGLAPVKLD